MNTTDPIADFLTRIRNGIRARHRRIDVPASKMKRAMTSILADQKYIAGFSELAEGPQGLIRINLKYADGVNAIQGLRRVSRPGLRVYAGAEELPRVLNGLGIAIISTSQGLMTGRQARAKRIGGEVLCEIW
jgi:small subunit ribosomal protein S8